MITLYFPPVFSGIGSAQLDYNSFINTLFPGGATLSLQEYIQEILSTLPRISRNTGIPLIRLYLSFIRLFITQHVQLVDFQALYLYKQSSLGLDDYFIGRRDARLRNRLNKNSTPDERAAFNEKHRFNAVFKDFISRDWLYLPDSTNEDIRAFLRRNDTFLFKPDTGTQGAGIRLCRTEELDPEQFIAEYAGRPALLETFIRQHPDMTTLNPTSVNTVRIITVRKDNRVHILGAGLRCGGRGAHVDNFSSGGIAYPIDLDTGILSGPGQSTEYDEPYPWNPLKNRFMPGFQIPHWGLLTEALTRAALLPENIGLVGWDIAITPEGVEFVEGNIHPGMTVIQVSGNGAWKRLKDFLEN